MYTGIRLVLYRRPELPSCTALGGAVGLSRAVGFIAEAPDAELPVEMHFYYPVARRVPEAVEPAKATDAKGKVISKAEETGDAADREGSSAVELRGGPEGRLYVDAGPAVDVTVKVLVKG